MEKICSVEDCTTPVTAKGLCRKHYNRMRRKGSTDDRRKNAAGPCSIDGCDKPRAGFGLCDTHYRAERRKQIPDSARKRPPIEGRICPTCGTELPSDDRRGKIYCSRKCKEQAAFLSGRNHLHVKKSYYQRRYNLTPDEADELRAGGCQICGSEGGEGRWGNLHIDHDHATGKVRGVLCTNCNTGIGKFKDSPELLRKAIEYLMR